MQNLDLRDKNIADLKIEAEKKCESKLEIFCFYYCMIALTLDTILKCISIGKYIRN